MRATRSVVGALAWALSLPAVAHELAGAWISTPPSPPGMIRFEALTFTQHKSDFSGELDVFPSEGHPLRVTQIKLDGNSLSFVTTEGGQPGAPQRQTHWQGKFTASDELQMLRTSGPRPAEQTQLRHFSERELATLKDEIAKNTITQRIRLPAQHDLPYNGLAARPPMGWNSWNQFFTRVDDKTVRAAADALVSSGLRDAGYLYVNIDDGWQGRRDKAGALQPNSKFPDMKALADYVHAKGLKLGIYSSPGPFTCGGYVGSHGHETEDAQAFARWGIDLLKYDWCSAAALYKTQQEMQALYQKMGAAVGATGRPMVYSLCQYGLFDVGAWGRKVGGNLWRTGDDAVIGSRWASISVRFEKDGRPEYAGPGGWNDPDIMLIGNGGMTTDEYRTHMTLWVMLAAPLLLGNDLNSMTPDVKAIVMNREVIGIDQDPLGKQGRRLTRQGSVEIWTRPLVNGATAVAMFNRGETAATATATWSELGLTPRQIRDLWQQKDVTPTADHYSTMLRAHGSALLRVASAR